MNLPGKQVGFGLMEVLIAVLILAVSLLAIASLQTRSLQYNQSAYWRSQANIMAYDVMERLRVDRSLYMDVNGFNSNFGAPGNAMVADWVDRLNQVIPGGEGQISCQPLADVNTTLCTVSVRWLESNIFGDDIDAAELDAEARTTFTYVSNI